MKLNSQKEFQQLLKSGELSKNELAFIGFFNNFIEPFTFEVKVDDEYVTLENIGKLINVGKNTISSVLKELESKNIIKVITRHKEPPIIYFNPLDNIANEKTIEIFNQNNHLKNEAEIKTQLNTTKGEYAILNYLSLNRIKYNEQFSFDDCVYRNQLRFDFAVLNEKNIVQYLIEYDGEGHFQPITFGNMSQESAEEQFNIIKECDQIKNQYCENNNIPFYRIPYWHFDDIEEILNRIIHNQPLEVDETSFLVSFEPEIVTL